MLSFDEFTTTILNEIRPENSDPLLPHTRLVEDLEFDSFDLLRAAILIEALANLDVPPEEPPIILTLSSAYEVYQRFMSSETTNVP
jgi:acyl carrier protein